MTTAAQTSREMPRYKCHKEVWALKIARIEPEKLPVFSGATCKGSFVLRTACGKCERCVWESQHGPKRGAVIVPADEGFAPFLVDSDYIVRHKPEAGGYFVQYVDGYKSFSPAQAFEEGYTRADLNALELGAAVRAAGLAGK